MAYTTYVPKTFTNASRASIQAAREIIAEYVQNGFDLTLRQLYYQFVARDLIPNTQRSYKRLGSLINDARLAGEIDWDHLVDRTRSLQSLSSWDTPLISSAPPRTVFTLIFGRGKTTDRKCGSKRTH